ncbi:hypothetical protein COV93_05430 [Candidatus Woesearchaeota archaeon CG11_big_fil_rev_8_21_14_0_20_43_8]|nr:MAG: hypothetical protein COV93_05430 [Candidatus Woesearchaeota archaeon CG11_big_fil_rev_8_21_14_0_20_43_8]PIO05196.1 MAG: hypothetical protein COT47_05780 [Candidatus Woesearchaeota archaeon CG08_land_8_20_14_0_20_43_7]
MEKRRLNITYSVQSHLWSNYNPRSRELKGSFILAGKGVGGDWYSSCAMGGNRLIDMILHDQKLPEGILAMKDAKMMPWIQFIGKRYTSELMEFIYEHISPISDDMLIMKPTHELGKNHFVIEYITFADRNIVQHELQAISPGRIDYIADMQISLLMDSYVASMRKEGLEKIISDQDNASA